MEFFYWMKAYLPNFFCCPWFLFQIVAEEHGHCPLPLLRELFVVVTQANDETITRVYRVLTSVSRLQVDRVVEHLLVASLEKVAPLPRGEWNCLRDRATKYDWLALVSLTGKRKSEKEEFVVSMELLLDEMIRLPAQFPASENEVLPFATALSYLVAWTKKHPEAITVKRGKGSPLTLVVQYVLDWIRAMRCHVEDPALFGRFVYCSQRAHLFLDVIGTFPKCDVDAVHSLLLAALVAMMDPSEACPFTSVAGNVMVPEDQIQAYLKEMERQPRTYRLPPLPTREESPIQWKKLIHAIECTHGTGIGTSPFEETAEIVESPFAADMRHKSAILRHKLPFLVRYRPYTINRRIGRTKGIAMSRYNIKNTNE